MKLLWQNTTRHPLASYKPMALEYVAMVKETFKLSHEEVSIIIVSTRRMKEMNYLYRQKNEPTDVLTFPGDGVYLGDIVICYDVAKAKAIETQQTTEEYMQFCIVHGLLHAVGYDHQTPRSYDEMMNMQEQLIQRRTL